MNSDMLLNRIRMAQQGLIGVHKKLYTLEHLLPSPDPAQFAETAKSAALLSERSTASLRGFPVHVLGEELTACGTISELSRRISVIRSRNISMSCVFQNLAGLQNRYPQNQWQEILGNCDVQLFLGCTDQLTAEYVSQRTGIASVAVSSTSKVLSTLRVSDYTPQYRESSGVGKRPVLTPDEVLRLPVDEALVILRGHKVLKVHKMDYSLHPAYKQLRECKASAHIPEWRKVLPETLEAPPAETAKASPKVPPRRRGRPAKSKAVVATDKESIITKPENEKEIPHGNEQ